MSKLTDSTLLDRIESARPPYFWWILALILSVCFTILSWTLCYTIFNNPEVPRHYKIMKALGRLPIHEDYAHISAPKLSTSRVKTLRNQLLALSATEVSTINNSMMRSYITNFKEKTFSSYLTGSFKVLETRPLTNNDVITGGFAIKLQAYTQEDQYIDPAPYPVIAEIIFPTPYSESHKGFHQGDIIKLGITPHFAAILHTKRIERDDDDTIAIITAVSLGSKIKPPHAGPLDLKPPQELNLEGKLPLFSSTVNTPKRPIQKARQAKPAE